MTTLGSYILTGQVAEGATARVFRAEHETLGRPAAVKVLLPHLASDTEAVERFRHEAQLIAALEHPAIVEVYQFGVDGDTAWYAMQWIDGAPLDDVLDRRGPLTPEQSVGVVRDALTGLAFVHERDVVHGDISLANVMVDESGKSLLVDFGVASPSGTAGVLGTPAFASPEAAAGQPVTARSDVYSSAAVLYTLLSGSAPLQGPDIAGTWRRHREEEAPLLSGHGDDIGRVLQKAMALDPERRHPDAGALLADLEDAAERRFGSGWLARAGVAGLAAGIAPTVRSLAAAAEGDAPQGSSATTSSATSTSSVSLKLVLGAAAVAVVVGGAAIFAVASSGSDDTDSAAPASSTSADDTASSDPSAAGEPDDGAEAAAGSADLVFAGDENFSIQGPVASCGVSESMSDWWLDGASYPDLGDAFELHLEDGFEVAKWVNGKDGYLAVGNEIRATTSDGGRRVDIEMVMQGDGGSVSVTGSLTCP